jgi:hypothetical protein
LPFWWTQDFTDFAAVIRAGRAIADAIVAEKLYARAMGYSHPAVKIMKSGSQPLTVAYTRHYPPDTQACLFWLRNGRPQNWRDKVEPRRIRIQQRSSARSKGVVTEPSAG